MLEHEHDEANIDDLSRMMPEAGDTQGQEQVRKSKTLGIEIWEFSN